jgi:trans-2,3-dihydro-3-hydroxyanthranilate isomerase
VRIEYLTVDVFTWRAFGGNPLAVLPDGRGLSEDRMQAIAREFNYPETTFVLPPEDPAHAARLRIFTPARELPFAGHPTLGTAHVLAATGRIPLAGETTNVLLEEAVGPVPVAIRARGGRPVFAQLTAAHAPEFGPPPPPDERILPALSLRAEDLPPGEPPRAVSCGLPFLLVAVRSREALGRAAVRMDRWAECLEGAWTSMVYLYCRDPELPGSDLRARMFAPTAGVPEDPATGSAGVALAGLLASKEEAAEGTLRWVVEQGFEMGRPSILEIEADKEGGRVARTRVGGASVLVCEGRMEIPDEEEGAGAEGNAP